MARGDDLKPTDIAISEATGDAVHSAGKQVYVGHMLGRGQPTVNAWTNPELAEFIPLRLVPELEKMATGQDGWPHITRALARMQGFALYRLPPVGDGAAAQDWLGQIGAISNEAADVVTKICASLATGGGLNARAVRQHDLIIEAEQLVAVACRMLAELRAVAGERP